MTSGRTIILNPTLPASVKRRQFLLNSLRKSGLTWSEEIEETRIIITYAGEPKRNGHTSSHPNGTFPTRLTLDKCLRSRCQCQPDDVEYWDEMIRLSGERERTDVQRIQIRLTWQSEQWAETWAVPVSEHLAVNRGDGYWTITHVPTGLAAGSASTLKDAIRVAQAVAHWPEWAALRAKDDLTPEFRRKASEAFKVAA
jgi:hypothetical protein